MSDKIFVYPTDTVWGIGGDATQNETYEKIARIKRNSIDKPLSLLFSDIDQLDKYIDLNDKTKSLIGELKDFEITFGLPKKDFIISLPKRPFSNTEYVCFRVLTNKNIKKIIDDIKMPIITTSLNIAGEPPIVSSAKAQEFCNKHIKEVSFINEDKNLKLSGNSSTIILISESNYTVVREGEKIEEIMSVLNKNGYNERL